MSKLNELRTIANLHTLSWNSLETSTDWKPEDNVWWYNLSFDQETGQASPLLMSKPEISKDFNTFFPEGSPEFSKLIK